MTVGTWARLGAVVAGVWTTAAPALLGFGGPARLNALVVGPIAASLALVSLSEVTRGVRWVVLLAGIWLLAASLVFGAPASARLGQVLGGVLLGVGSAFGGARWERYGGGWAALATGSPGGGRESRDQPHSFTSS